MKMTNISTAFAGAAVAAAAIVAGAPMALAEDGGVTTSALGSQAKLDNGAQGWTVTDLKPSTDTIDYQTRGTLWEVTATNEALQGSVTPIVSNFNIRAADGQNYRALFQVPSKQGVNPATLAQGQKTSGKIYFDVTGDQPTEVVYNAGGRDLLVWDKPAAPAAAPAAGAPKRPAPAAAPAATPAAPAGTGAGSRATDLPAATPAPGAPAATPAGTEAVPAAPAPGAPAVPAAPATEPALVPAGTQPVVTTPAPAPAVAPASSHGTAS
nr:MPT63 family protein [Mycolicibacterium neworleansense]